MYRAFGSIAPEQRAGRFVEREERAVFTAEIHLAVFHNRLAAERERKRYRPQHATGSLIKRVSPAITAAGKYFSATERECAAQWSDERSHPLRHTTFTTECTQSAEGFCVRRLDDSFRSDVDRSFIRNRRRRQFAAHFRTPKELSVFRFQRDDLPPASGR